MFELKKTEGKARRGEFTCAHGTVRAWDPDFTKVTPEEAKNIAKAEMSGFIAEDEIDWDNLSQYAE